MRILDTAKTQYIFGVGGEITEVRCVLAKPLTIEEVSELEGKPARVFVEDRPRDEFPSIDLIWGKLPHDAPVVAVTATGVGSAVMIGPSEHYVFDGRNIPFRLGTMEPITDTSQSAPEPPAKKINFREFT